MKYVLKIKKSNATGASLEDIEKYLKIEFKSFDYMIGFLDGYLFDNYKVISLEEFEKETKRGLSILENYHIKFITINDFTMEDNCDTCEHNMSASDMYPCCQCSLSLASEYSKV